jgi:2-C-methyl-D-erythritol 4-phosphate cytidylyltransferase / 2-C-methyl-D-erythritol 2,4-cyclodiphosphate synthase
VTFPAGCAAVVTAAGESRRMGGRTKKEYRLLGDVPVLARAVLPFLEEGLFPVVVTVPRGHLGEAAALLAPHLPSPGVRLVEGGATRQQSVLQGLRALAEDSPGIVLIHDGARPWLARELVRRVALAARERGGCVPVVEVSEAVKQVGAAEFVEQHLRRGAIRFAQTPQGFHFARILAAHEKAAAAGASCVDDAEVFALFEGPVAWIEGDTDNRKITRECDLGGA